MVLAEPRLIGSQGPQTAVSVAAVRRMRGVRRVAEQLAAQEPQQARVLEVDGGSVTGRRRVFR